MKVKVAKTAGFCMGVRRAMELVLNASRSRRPDEVIHTYGPLIHNTQVLQMLEGRGVYCLDHLEDAGNGRVVIRAHGIPPQERKALKRRGFEIINATCPRVARVQGIIKKHVLQGYQVIIVGDVNHAEVIGLQGFANGRALVLNRPEEVEQLPPAEKVLVVAQTTQDESSFEEIVERLRRRYPEAKMYNTICDSTRDRQEEVRRLCREVDAMVVVGGRQSANTRRLAQIATASGVPTYQVEREDELQPQQFQEHRVVGVTAGASTPNWQIRRVVYELENIQPPGRRPLLGITGRRLLRFLFLSNLYVAGGAGCLSYAAAVLEGVRPRFVDFAITFLYVFAMHLLNRYADKAARFKDPSRGLFYDHYKVPFSLACMAALIALLALGASQGMAVFVALAAVTALGLLYSVRIFPGGWWRFIRVGKLKDIPASKTLFVAGAWSAVATVVPALRRDFSVGWPTIFALAVIFILVFIRSGLFDMLDIQADRLVGEETIPVVIGEGKTRRLLVSLVVVLGILLAAAPSLRLATNLSYLLLLGCGYLGFCLLAHRHGFVRPGSLWFETMVETSFYLCGFLALYYRLLLGTA